MFNVLSSCIKRSFYSVIIIVCVWSTVDAMGRKPFIIKIPTASVLGICESHEGGHLMLLQLPGSGGNARLVLRQTNNNGGKVWEKGFLLALQPGQAIVSGSIAVLPNQKYAMTAIRNTPTTGGNEQETFILQLTSDASIESQKRFAGNHGALVPLEDGGFVAAGFNSNSVASGVTIAAMQTGGTVRWAKMYSGEFHFSPTAQGPQTLLVTSTGELIFAAGMAPPGGTLVFKTNLDGNLIWSKRIHGAGLSFISATSAGGNRTVLLFDQYSSGSIYVVALDGSGDRVWTKSFRVSNLQTRGLVVAQNGEGVAIAGRSGSEGFTAIVNPDGTLNTRSYFAAPICGPGFMHYDGAYGYFAVNIAQGGSLLFGLNASGSGCSMFRSTPAVSLRPDAVYVVEYTLTSGRWNPNRGTPRVGDFTPSLGRDVVVCNK